MMQHANEVLLTSGGEVKIQITISHTVRKQSDLELLISMARLLLQTGNDFEVNIKYLTPTKLKLHEEGATLSSQANSLRQRGLQVINDA